MTLLESIWAFLTDPANRAVLAWLGGGLVVALGGAWTAFTYFRSSSTTSKTGSEPAKGRAAHGSVAVGGDRKTPIPFPGSPQPSGPPPQRQVRAGKSRRRGKGGKR